MLVCIGGFPSDVCSLAAGRALVPFTCGSAVGGSFGGSNDRMGRLIEVPMSISCSRVLPSFANLSFRIRVQAFPILFPSFFRPPNRCLSRAGFSIVTPAPQLQSFVASIRVFPTVLQSLSASSGC